MIGDVKTLRELIKKVALIGRAGTQEMRAIRTLVRSTSRFLR